MLYTSNIAIRMKHSAPYCDYHVILLVTQLATLRRVVGRLSRDNPLSASIWLENVEKGTGRL